MTTPSPAEFTPAMLAASATNVMVMAHRIAYAQINSDLMVVQTSSNFSMVVEQQDTTIIGQPITALLWEFVGAEELLQDVLHGRSPSCHLEQINRGKTDDKQVYLDFLVVPLNKQHLDQGLLLLIEDRTKSSRLQQTIIQDRNESRLLQHQIARVNKELRRLNQLKSLFLFISAHDLRTPLTSINGYATLVSKRLPTAVDPSIIRYLEVIISESNRMGHLINNFINLDHVEQGGLTLQPEVCDLNSVIEEVVNVVEFDINNRHIVLDIETPDSPMRLWADRDKLFYIVYNLLNNALQRTPQNRRILVQAGVANETVWLQIQNDGNGITEERLKSIFNLYYHQTKATTRSRREGSELSLYMVKMLVNAHQGDVEASSKHGKGSVFTVILPQALDGK